MNIFVLLILGTHPVRFGVKLPSFRINSKSEIIQLLFKIVISHLHSYQDSTRVSVAPQNLQHLVLYDFFNFANLKDVCATSFYFNLH